MDKSATSSNDSSGYTVVARRYRPRSFSELIGQDHIAHALDTAIASGRVGHAYLFTGARGVGKTSSARIFAKALNAVDGELAADIAQAIDSGEDMDVIEIDGASNRGIEEIRQLRANVNVRPSRARYKIYIIDEVHMLTNQAFNALLKTLEEPPQHVKFIFCTTDPDKLPITVLSRCQRFDFVPIKLDAIQAKLKEICTAEGFAADDDALALLARRAAGSMRDSQSLLEQVMSFSQERISVEQVQQLLGIADEGRLLALTQALADKNALQAIELVAEAARSGADAGQLAEQLLNYFRDVMAVGIGGGPELLLLANPAGHAGLKILADRWGVQSILAAIQIMDESLVRMRSSVSAQALLEVALVQICQLSQLASIPALLEAMRDAGRGTSSPAGTHQASPQASPQGPSEKKNAETTSQLTNTASSPTASSPAVTAPVSQAGASIDSGSASTVHSTTVHNSAGDALTDATPLPAVAPAESPAVGLVPGASPAGAGVEVATGSTASAAAVSPPRELSPTASSNIADPNARSGPPARSVQEPRPTSPPSATAMSNPAQGSPEALGLWRTAVGSISDMLADYASLAIAVVPDGADHWNILFPPGAGRSREVCEQSERRQTLERAVAQVAKRPLRLTFAVLPGEPVRSVAATQPSTNRVQKLREISDNPYVKKCCEVLDGEILRVDPPVATQSSNRTAGPHASSARS